jgi:MOSC domain-containing protein YiiM
LGIVGDRYAGKPAHRDASVTVLAVESVEALVAELGSGPLDPLLARRNVVLHGAEVEALRGELFSIDCGEGGVLLQGGRPANPCAWMTRCSPPARTAACAAGAGSGAARSATACCGSAPPSSGAPCDWTAPMPGTSSPRRARCVAWRRAAEAR